MGRRGRGCFVFALLAMVLLVAPGVRASFETVASAQHNGLAFGAWNLVPGWNLVGMPLVPDDASVATFLQPAGTDVVVWTYSGGNWSCYAPGSTKCTLTTFQVGRAYWVWVSSGMTLGIGGTPGTGAIDLSPGWNFVSDFDTSEWPAVKALHGLGSRGQVAWTYVDGRWLFYNPADPEGSSLTGVSPLHGYWIKIKSGQGGIHWAADTTPPAVTARTPSILEQNADPEQAITVTFSEEVDPATVNSGTFSVTDGTAGVPGTLACDGTVATFTPSQKLAYEKSYSVTVSTGVKDYWGNALTEAVSWQFKTAPEDRVSPWVSAVYPEPNRTNVSIATTVSAAFSERMAASTVNGSALTLTGGAVVPGAVTYLEPYNNGAAPSAAVFTPSGPLAYGTVYTGRATDAATDRAGNKVQPYTWSFTTEHASPAGIWNGSFHSTLSGQTMAIKGVVTGDGQIRFASWELGEQFVGTGSVNGMTFSGTLTGYLSDPDYMFPNGSRVATFTMSGQVSPKQSLTGTYSGGGDSGTFSLTYDPVYERGSSFSTVAGSWRTPYDPTDPSFHISFTARSDGTFTGQATADYIPSDACTFTGIVSIQDPAHDVYSVTMTMSSCDPFTGSYSGLGFVTDAGGTNHTLVMGLTGPQSLPLLFERYQ